MFPRAPNSQRMSHVRFQEDTHVSSDYYNTGAAPASSKTDANVNWYNGPRFPNLQMMFKKKSIPSFDEELARREEVAPVLPRPAAVVEQAREEVYQETIRQPAARQEEDISMEEKAREYIKLAHKKMELEKLMSMKAKA